MKVKGYQTNDLVIKSRSNGCLPTTLSTPNIRTTPAMRKDKKEGIEKTSKFETSNI